MAHSETVHQKSYCIPDVILSGWRTCGMSPWDDDEVFVKQKHLFKRPPNASELAQFETDESKTLRVPGAKPQRTRCANDACRDALESWMRACPSCTGANPEFKEAEYLARKNGHRAGWRAERLGRADVLALGGEGARQAAETIIGDVMTDYRKRRKAVPTSEALAKKVKMVGAVAAGEGAEAATGKPEPGTSVIGVAVASKLPAAKAKDTKKEGPVAAEAVAAAGGAKVSVAARRKSQEGQQQWGRLLRQRPTRQQQKRRRLKLKKQSWRRRTNRLRHGNAHGTIVGTPVLQANADHAATLQVRQGVCEVKVCAYMCVYMHKYTYTTSMSNCVARHKLSFQMSI